MAQKPVGLSGRAEGAAQGPLCYEDGWPEALERCEKEFAQVVDNIGLFYRAAAQAMRRVNDETYDRADFRYRQPGGLRKHL